MQNKALGYITISRASIQLESIILSIGIVMRLIRERYGIECKYVWKQIYDQNVTG